MTFTPKETKQYEHILRTYAITQRPKGPLEGPLAVEVLFNITRPKSVTRSLPWKRPDLDNFLKAVLDAMNGILWVDDGQLVEVFCSKRYGERGSIVLGVTEVTTT